MTPNDPPEVTVDYSKPVAYDNLGRPLYARPPEPQSAQSAQQPAVSHQYVHVTRPMAPNELEIPEYIRERHAQALKEYPRLNLSDGEYILAAVRRHPIGLIEIWGAALLLILAMAALLVTILTGEGFAGNDTATALGVTGLGIMSILVLIGALALGYVYNQNKFFLTNESVIQEIQNSIFSNHEQTVSLANIEDASFKQNGLLPYLLNYGTIRLSTEGDETTYSFSYVANPKKHIAVLNNAVEAFKNGRPVDPAD